MKKLDSMLIWGDSLLKGIVFHAEEGRYSVYEDNSAAYLARKTGITVQNRSRFGYTAQRGRALLQRDLQNYTADAALIEFGGNDCDFNWAEVAKSPLQQHTPNTPPELFRRELLQMAQLLRDSGITPLMMSLPPIDPERYFAFITRDGLERQKILAFLGDVDHIYRWQELYSDIIADAARQAGCGLIDVRRAFLQEWDFSQYLCEDGIHLNAAGQKYLGDVLIDHVQKMRPDQPAA